MKNKIENVLIVAGGKNTRFKEMSIFPKVLLPLENYSSILSYNVEKFKEKKAKVHLVINQDYYEMVKDYVKNNMLDVEVIKSTNADGSCNTLKSVKDRLPQKNTLVIWSDLILSEDGISFLFNSVKRTDNEFLIFTNPGEYRCWVASSYKKDKDSTSKEYEYLDFCSCNSIKTMPKKKQGNVPGIYFYKNLPEFEYPETIHNFDFFEYIVSKCQFNYLEVKPLKIVKFKGEIKEFRDLEIYMDYYKGKSSPKVKTRFFNTITPTPQGLAVIKQCINKEFDHLIEKEIDWYSIVKDKELKCVPKIFLTSKDKHFIEMENLVDYVPISQYLKMEFEEDSLDKFFDKYFEMVEELHSVNEVDMPKDDVVQDCTIEFESKVLDRCGKIKNMLVNYNETELKTLLEKANRLIIKTVLPKHKPYGTYCFTHGDLNGSNVMYNIESNEIKFIDPRGYFGKTKMIGLKEYDYAKILYCLSGYDEFNNGRYVYTKDYYDEPSRTIKNTQNEYIPKKLDTNFYHMIVGIIYVALAQYIAQDIFKANIAYEHGMKILRKYVPLYENEMILTANI